MMMPASATESLAGKRLGSPPSKLNQLHIPPMPAIGEDGNIHLPGLTKSLSIQAYLPLVHLYASVLDANRILDRYRSALGQTQPESSQTPLTPLVPSKQMPNLYYKREDLTITCAYKLRGALVGMAKMMEGHHCQDFLAVSTGNHALGVLKAAELLKPTSVRIVVPKNTAPGKLEKIETQLAGVRQAGVSVDVTHVGETFDEARAWAISQDKGEYYLDPYNDPWVVAGQGTIGLELYRQIAPLLHGDQIKEIVVIAPIGGGGLLSGTAAALKMAAARDARYRHALGRFVGVKLASMDSIYGDAIKVNQMAAANETLLTSLNTELFEITDEHIAAGMQHVNQDLSILVEGACGGTLYPVLNHPTYQPSPERLVICLLSGGNVGVLPEQL